MSGLVIICIPFYRYRYTFRIKADHPQWSAGECLRRCRELTDGEKWRIFKHDCSYWKIFLIPLGAAVLFSAGLTAFVTLLAGVISGAETISIRMALAGSAISCLLIGLYVICFASAAIAAFYNGVGQSILYRKIAGEKT